MGQTSTADSAQARALDRKYDEPAQPTERVNFKPDPASEAAEAKRVAGVASSSAYRDEPNGGRTK